MTDPKFLGVVLYTKLFFESKLGTMRKALCLFDDLVLILSCVWSFLLLVLEYCSYAWMSAAASYLCLLDRVVSKAVKLSDGLVVCNLEHRRRVAALCMFHKISCNPNNAL